MAIYIVNKSFSASMPAFDRPNPARKEFKAGDIIEAEERETVDFGLNKTKSLISSDGWVIPRDSVAPYTAPAPISNTESTSVTINSLRANNTKGALIFAGGISGALLGYVTARITKRKNPLYYAIGGGTIGAGAGYLISKEPKRERNFRNASGKSLLINCKANVPTNPIMTLSEIINLPEPFKTKYNQITQNYGLLAQKYVKCCQSLNNPNPTI